MNLDNGVYLAILLNKYFYLVKCMYLDNGMFQNSYLGKGIQYIWYTTGKKKSTTFFLSTSLL